MSEALDFLVDLLDLESIEVNIFRGVSPNEDRQRVFGGQVAAQSLMAAGRTVETGRPHSLHAYFLRPGDPYRAHPLRGGPHPRRPVLHHPPGGGHPARPGHLQPVGLVPRRRAGPEPPIPHARGSRSRGPRPTGRPASSPTARPWATGSPGPTPSTSATSASCPFSHEAGKEPVQRLWIRADGTLPDDPLLHACIAAYASDMSLFDTMLAPHDVSWDDADFMGASLDHCMWFHRPFRADEWLLYDMDSPTRLRGPGPGPRLPVHPGRRPGRLHGPGGPDATGPRAPGR